MSLYFHSGVSVKLHLREELSDAVARFVSNRTEAAFVSGLHELEVRNAPRLKRFREEIDVLQLAASPAMIERNQADGRMVLRRFDWSSVRAKAERLPAATTTFIGVRTVDLLHVAVACTWASFGLATLDRRQRTLARVLGLDTVDLLGSTRS